MGRVSAGVECEGTNILFDVLMYTLLLILQSPVCKLHPCR